MTTELVSKEVLGEKEWEVLSRVHSLVRQWPNRDFYPKIIHALLRYPPEFKKIRSSAHLSRIVISEYFYTRRLSKDAARQPKRRHLFVKILRTKLEYPFGCKSVIGILVVFNLMKQREVFEELHVVEAIRRFVPQVKPIQDSFFDYADKRQGIQSVYIEVEKEGNFSLEETALLREKLPGELKGCVEQLVPLTFMRRNEEEVYRNILALRDQLKTVRDIPQATITFEEQTQFDLFFTVVVLRLVKDGDPSVQELFMKANPEMLYIPDRVDDVGHLRRKWRKQATVFRVQLPKSQFFRKDRSVNLYTARKAVAARLGRAFGQVRDYNGGLILKQNERLEDFLSIMAPFSDEFLLENFFYSITPIAMQSILPASLVKEWFLAFSKLMKTEMDAPYRLIFCKHEEALLVIVRAEEESFKSELLARINELQIPSLELAFSEIKMNGSYCFGFLYRPSQFGMETSFAAKIEEVMEEWGENRSHSAVLRLSVLDNDLTLDPRLSQEEQSSIVIKMLFEGLTRIGRDGKPQMAIAQSFDLSPDNKTYTFHLRDCKWSDGTKVTAYDFEYSWKKAIASPSSDSDALLLLKNAKKARLNQASIDAVGIQVLDDRTLVVELERAAPYFLEVTAHWSFCLINSHIDQKYPGWAYQGGETYVCNGPFRLVDWKHNREIILEKNPHYWDSEAVNLTRVEIALLGRGQDDLRMLKNKELDIIGRPMGFFPIQGLGEIEKTRRIEFPLQGIYSVCFNTRAFPFNHKKLRQAFAYAIDRTELATLIPQEFGKESYSLLPDKLSNCMPFPKRDLQMARELFREGLGEIGFVRSDFPKLSFLFCTRLHREGFLRTLVEQWREAFGIEVSLQLSDWRKYNRLRKAWQFQISGIELKALWNDAHHLLQEIGNYLDCERFDDAVMVGKFEEAERLLGEEVPMIPLYQLKGNYLKSDALHGECTSEFFHADFKWSYIG